MQKIAEILNTLCMKQKVCFVLIMFILFKLSAVSFIEENTVYKTGLKIKLPVLNGAELNGWYNGENIIWGASVNFTDSDGTFLAGGKGGNLSFSGGVSLLNNPLLFSSVSPFFRAQKKISLFSAAFPDGSSFLKPLSLFINTSLFSDKASSGKLGFSGAFSEKMEGIWSVNYRKRDKKKEFDFQWLIKTNPLFQGKNDSWYLSKNIFAEETLKFSSLFQESLCINNLSFLLSEIFYLDYYGNLLPVFRMETSGKRLSGAFSVNFLPDVTSSSGKELERCISAKVNFQDQKKLKREQPFMVKYGVTVFNKLSLEEKDWEMKGTAGFRIFSVRNSISGSIYGEMLSNLDGIDIKETRFTKGGINLSNNYYMDKISPTIKGSCVIIPENSGQNYKTTESCSVILYLGSNPSINLNLSAELSGQKFRCSDRKMDIGITSKYKSRLFDIAGKISMSLEF